MTATADDQVRSAALDAGGTEWTSPTGRTYRYRRFTEMTGPGGTVAYKDRLPLPSPGVVALALTGEWDDGATRPATIHRMRLSDGTPLPETVLAGRAFTTMPITTASLYVFGLDSQLTVLPIHCMPDCSIPTSITSLPSPLPGDGAVTDIFPLIAVGSTVLFIYVGDEHAILTGTTFAYRVT